MIVDAFTVAGGYPARPVKVGIDELHAAMDKNGVDMAMTMSLRAVQADAELGNDYIYGLAKEDPRILPVAIVDPRDHLRVGELIDKAVQNDAAALCFHVTGIPYPVNSILFRRALKSASCT